MKKKQYYIAAALLCIPVIAFSGCVSKKKFLELDESRMACEDREKALNIKIKDQEFDIDKLQAKNQQLEIQIDKLTRANSDCRDIVDAGNSEQQTLNMLLQDKVNELEAREKTIADLQSIIARQKEAVDSLLEKLKKALVNFSSDELTIELKSGKVYIAMSDQLLFSSGSVKIDDKGKAALGKLAEVLRQQPEIDIVIEGHTDTVPIQTDRFKDNWDLSVLRATSVVRVLTEDNFVNPQQLNASGRGEYFPVVSNDTPEGRARNRRTEIILSPNLDELFKVLRTQDE